MQTHQLKRNNPNMKRVIVARGGKRGKTSGRGGKGQSARAGNKRRPEWRDIIKRLPKLRGRGVSQLKSINEIVSIVDLAMLDSAFNANEVVNPSVLVEKGIISTLSGRIPTIKILGDGAITKSLKISGCLISKSAKVAIEKVGGTVTVVTKKEITSAESKKV